MNFKEAFVKLLGHEGGYVNNPKDPGGETNWGVTKRVAEANGYRGSMKDFTQDDAQKIYLKLYWNAVKADDLPDPIRFDVFDAAVNSGVSQASKWLQRAIGAQNDGVIGTKTIEALKASNPFEIKLKFLSQRLSFMTELPTWSTFGKGWARRIAENMKGN
jgi:hypothetical protein